MDKASKNKNIEDSMKKPLMVDGTRDCLGERIEGK